MKKLKTAAVTAGLTAALAGSFFVGQENAEVPAPSALAQRSGKKTFVVYSKKNFANPSFQVQSRVSHLTGLKMQESLDGVNGFQFQGSDEDAEKVKEQLPEGWKVTEDRLYKINLVGCQKAPDPVPGPVYPPTPAQVPWGIYKINAIEAQTINDAKQIVVCIADTGADFNHPDLKEMLIGGVSTVPGVSSWDDDQGHGTHVAGTVAAQSNAQDVVGVSQAKIYAVKVLDRTGAGYGSWISKGIVACVKAKAHIISMSLGSPASAGSDPLIADAIDYAMEQGIKVVAAAGNDGGAVGYPAAQAGVIAVSATDSSDRLAYFSSRGPQISYAAPGVDVVSLRVGGGVVSFSGTSMATPHVAGVLALALASGKKEILADDIGLPKEHQGKGRVNALKTVRGQ